AVARIDLIAGPAWSRARERGELAEGPVPIARRDDVAAGQGERPITELEARIHAFERMGKALISDPCLVLRGRILGRRIRRDAPAIARGGARLLPLALLFGDEIEQALAVLRHEGVEIDEMRDARSCPVGDAGRHHAAIGMA